MRPAGLGPPARDITYAQAGQRMLHRQANVELRHPLTVSRDGNPDHLTALPDSGAQLLGELVMKKSTVASLE
jgi:hypothetical protein